MRAAPRRHGWVRPAANGGSRRRKGRAHESPSRPDERYGPRRLRALYEIGKILTTSDISIEETVPALLSITSTELPLRSAVLTVKSEDPPKASVWHSPDASADDRRWAEARALKSFAQLTGAPAPAVKSVAALPPLGGRIATRPERGRFITCPLIVQDRPIFGSLHLEGFVPFDEEDIEFVSAIANQFAVALDRYQGRLHETALRLQAEELNRFKTDLVSVVSHEFGNSLTVMKIATSLLEQKIPAKWLKGGDRLFEMILTNIDTLNRAVQNLLNMARLEAGKLAIDVKATDAAEVLKNVLKGLLLLCENKGIKASLDLPEGLRPVCADQASLTLVVSNLLSNAIKYTPENGRIALGILPENGRPGYYRVFVQDSGIGVSVEDRAKILGGHFRSESGKKMTSKGFGVGLSLAQQIVEAHGSSIEIEGAPGKGSRFSFLLAVAS